MAVAVYDVRCMATSILLLENGIVHASTRRDIYLSHGDARHYNSNCSLMHDTASVSVFSDDQISETGSGAAYLIGTGVVYIMHSSTFA